MHTGTIIRDLRKKHDMTQEELGELLGVKKAAVQKYEKGDVVNLKMSTIRKLCDIFKVSPTIFIFPEAEEMDRKHNSKQLYFEVETFESIEELWGHDTVEVVNLFQELNIDGQQRVLEFTNDISEVNRYKKKFKMVQDELVDLEP